MKTLFFIALISFSGISLHAQKNLDEAIFKGLKDLTAVQSAEDFISVSNYFERLSAAEPQQWLPAYYSAYLQIISAFNSADPVQKEAILQKAQNEIAKALKIAPEESELHTLQGMLYQAYIGIDPARYGQEYSGKAAACFNDAQAYDTSNPRPVYLQALSVFNTPKQYGGGLEAACPVFGMAAELFKKFQPKGSIYPNWGAEDCQTYINNCASLATN